MALKKEFIDKRSYKFTIVQPSETLADYEVQVHTDETYIVFVIHTKENTTTYYAASLSNLHQTIEAHPHYETLYKSQPFKDYNLAPATHILRNGRQGIASVTQWLQKKPGQVLIVLDDNEVIGVLCNPLLGARGNEVRHTDIKRGTSVEGHGADNYNQINEIDTSQNTRFSGRRRLPNESSKSENRTRFSRNSWGNTKQDKPAPLDNIRFTTYYPSKGQANQRYSLIMYAHTDAMTNDVLRDVQQHLNSLGGDNRDMKTTDDTFTIASQMPITVHIESEVIGFNPARITKIWQNDILTFGFAFTLPPHVSEVSMQLYISINNIEIASQSLTIKIAQETSATINPLRAAELKSWSSTSIKRYRKIFISYSRKDKTIVETFAHFQELMGDDILMDTRTLKPGQDWQEGLVNMIKQADVFMLFWSGNSSESENVRHEWEYALDYHCTDDKCRSFIRPISWEKPMTKPPKELSHLNFMYRPITQTITHAHESLKKLRQRDRIIREDLQLVATLGEIYNKVDNHILQLVPPQRYQAGQILYQLYDALLDLPITHAEMARNILNCMKNTLTPSTIDAAQQEIIDNHQNLSILLGNLKQKI